jgi:hypothetical protein
MASATALPRVAGAPFEVITPGCSLTRRLQVYSRRNSRGVWLFALS